MRAGRPALQPWILDLVAAHIGHSCWSAGLLPRNDSLPVVPLQIGVEKR